MKRLSFLVVASMLMTTLMPTMPASAATNGSLIRTDSSPAVYYVYGGKRFSFPNKKTFDTWYPDFSSVEFVTANELAKYPLVANVRYRPGVRLVKIQTDPKVYAVSRYGELRWITSESIATSLYGSDWNTKVDDVPDAFFTNYSLGDSITSAGSFNVTTEQVISDIRDNIGAAPSSNEESTPNTETPTQPEETPSETPSEPEPTPSEPETTPEPPAPTPGSNSQAVTGYTNVTYAANPTGSGTRYDIGGGSLDGDELDDVPWQSLKPGDVVNIFYRSQPYAHQILLTEQGTEADPIVINGVTGPNGERPVIGGPGHHVAINSEAWHPAYSCTILMINRRHDNGTYGVNAEHYVIQNIEINGANPSNTYEFNGESQAYGPRCRGVWNTGQYITFQGDIFRNNNGGVFVQSADDPGALSKNLIFRGNLFENNAYGNRDHQLYFQAVSDPGTYNIVEGNYFAPPQPGQESVAQLKIRGTGTVVRYNWFDSAHRTLDIVEAQDAIPQWMYENYTQAEILSYYRSSYVYGNVFVNDFDATNNPTSAAWPIHVGADSFDNNPVFGSYAGPAAGEPGMRGYESSTKFFHNTFFMRANDITSPNGVWRAGLFDLDNNNSLDATPLPGTLDAWNNIFEFAGDTRIGALRRSGTLNLNGANLLYTDTLKIFADSDDYAKNENAGDDPDANINEIGTMITSSANFVDALNTNTALKNFSLQAGSPAIGAATALPAELASFPVELQPVGPGGGGAVTRSSTNNLGAIE